MLYEILQDLQKQFVFLLHSKRETEYGIDETQGWELRGTSSIHHPVQAADAPLVLFPF